MEPVTIISAVAGLVVAITGLVKAFRSAPVRRYRRQRAERVLKSVPPPAGNKKTDVRVEVKQ